MDEVRAAYPGRADEDWRSGWDEGETYDELSRRVLPALVELGTKHEGGHVLAVTHAGPLRAAMAAAMGLSYDDARPLIGPLENCAVFRFAVQDGTIEAVD